MFEARKKTHQEVSQDTVVTSARTISSNPTTAASYPSTNPILVAYNLDLQATLVFLLFSTSRKIKNACPVHSTNEKPNRTEPLYLIFNHEPNRTVGSHETKRQISSSWKTKTKRTDPIRISITRAWKNKDNCKYKHIWRNKKT